MSFPTSYIKTTSSQVTRSADNASVDDLSGWFNAAEGALYIATGKIPDVFSSRIIVIQNSTNTANRIVILRSSTGRYQIFVSSGSTVINQSPSVWPVGESAKIALSYSDSGYVFTINGETLYSGTGGLPIGLDKIYIGTGEGGTGSGQPNVGIKALKFIPRALSATKLEALTAPEAN